jgi:hypothetical protein
MRHCGESEFPGWCGRVAVALALHVGAGWALAAKGSLDAAPVARAAETWLWLEAGAESPQATARATGGGGAVPEVGAVAARPAPEMWGDSPRHPAPGGRHPDTGRAVARAATAARELAPPRPVANSQGPAPMAAAASPDEHGAGRSAHDSSAALLAGASLTPSAAAGGLPSAWGVGGRAAGAGAGPRAAAAGAASTAARAPARLLGAGNRCADLFPFAAASDTGTVAVALEVAPSGQPQGARIVDEAPRGQGFALAASHCVRRLRFAPATDGSGRVVASRSFVRLQFQRAGASPHVAL